jgi:hypothetical protein
VLTGQATQREAADRFGVDRSTVVTICRSAKLTALDAFAAAVPGRPGPRSAGFAAGRRATSPTLRYRDDPPRTPRLRPRKRATCVPFRAAPAGLISNARTVDYESRLLRGLWPLPAPLLAPLPSSWSQDRTR